MVDMMHRGDWSVVASWIGFGLMHSVFASETVKQALFRVLPAWVPGRFRLMYNAASLGLVLVIGDLLAWDVRDEASAVILHTGAERIVCDVLGVAALLGFVSVCGAYDMMYFAGLRAVPSKPLGFSFLHRFVRNPWYTCSIVFLWTRNMDRAKLVTTVMMTLYFFIGSIFEEHRLKTAPGRLGEKYRAYCRLVPSIVPRPWQYLTAERAASLFSE